jgi:hypothetical protein
MTEVQNKTSATQEQPQEASEQTFFSNNIGVSIPNDDSISKNAFLVDALAKAKEINPDSVSVGTTNTTFSVDAASFGYFMHMVYCAVSEGHELSVGFDGIYPFKAKDQDDVERNFNGQMVTLREVKERM